MSRKVSLENKVKRDITRPYDTLFKSEVVEEQRTVRQTYHMDPITIEAIKLINFETREGISNVINRLLKNSIDNTYLEQARENLEKR